MQKAFFLKVCSHISRGVDFGMYLMGPCCGTVVIQKVRWGQRAKTKSSALIDETPIMHVSSCLRFFSSLVASRNKIMKITSPLQL